MSGNKLKFNKKVFANIISLQDYKKSKANKKIYKQKGCANNNFWFIGVKHNNPVRNSTEKFLLDSYSKFKKLNKTFILVIEGPKIKNKITNDQILRMSKESAVLAVQALKDGIKIVSVEPEFEEIIILANKLNIDNKKIAVWFFLSMLNQKIVTEKIKKIDCINLLKQTIKFSKLTDKNMNSLYHYIYETIAKQINNELIPKNLNDFESFKFNVKKLRRIINPSIVCSELNFLSAQLNKIRDYYIYTNIQRLQIKNNVLAVYGLNHVDCIKK